MLSHAGIYHRHLQRRENGKVDVIKLQPITYDSINHDYLVLGEKVGNAFQDGTTLK